MLNRFGPIDLFNLQDAKIETIELSLKTLLDKAKDSGSKSWKFFFQQIIDMEVMSQWVFNQRDMISRAFPKTKIGQVYKNRHVLIKQYGNNARPSAQSLSSRGFEGTNYRLVVSSDADHNLNCKYGEYLNLSGFLLLMRDSYPKPSHCEICNNGSPVGLCITCGNWFCLSCQFSCESCHNKFCISCARRNGPNPSAHHWYFHRT